jgi:hypothetical protein
MLYTANIISILKLILSVILFSGIASFLFICYSFLLRFIESFHMFVGQIYSQVHLQLVSGAYVAAYW